MRRWVRRWWRILVKAAVIAALLLGGLTWGAAQPWAANQFGYALAGRDGLPSTVYANGQAYSTTQVCAGADWCAADAAIRDIPRCYTQADLVNMHAWPLVQFDTVFTLFGAPRALLRPSNQVATAAVRSSSPTVPAAMCGTACRAHVG